MGVRFDQQDAITIGSLSGEIDGKTSPEIQEAFLPVLAESKVLVLDMKEVTFLSSAGLRMLLYVYRQTQAGDCRVALSGLDEQLRDTMTITGFIGFFEVYEHLDEAVAALKG